MKSIKVKICIMIALALVMIISFATFLGLTASANRYVTLSGASIFNTSGDAEIWAHAVTTEKDGTEITDADDYYYYTLFTFENDGDSIAYRRNLAYKWYYNTLDGDDYAEDESSEEESSETAPVAELGTGYFNLQIGFEAVNFKKFLITFETQQYNMTEDEKTVNYIVFLPTEGGVYAKITDDKQTAEAEAEDIDVSDCKILSADYISITLGESTTGVSGEYSVEICNVDRDGNKAASSETQTGVFSNVGKMYAKYVSSSTNPVTPITFGAEFAEREEGAEVGASDRARMVIYSLNGQSFVLNRDADNQTANTSRTIRSVENEDGTTHYEGGQINDTCPPVLCLDSGISYIGKGNELSFNYTAVDVLTQSPSTVTGYFMLTNEQYNAGVNADNYEEERLFKTVEDSDDVFIYPHAAHYVPKTGDFDGGVFGEGFQPVAAVKVYLKLTDTASTGGQSTYVFLDWFVDEQYKLHIGKDAATKHDYVAVAKDERGACFAYENYSDKTESAEWKQLVDEYQAEVDKAAENIRAGKDDFYLPSLEKLVGDNATAYTDMTFGIYYMVNTVDSSTSSATGKKSSQLSIDLQNAGDYIFTVYVTDSSANDMWYTDDKGERKEFSSADIWTMYDDEDEEGLADYLPWFRFTAGISEISVEDPGEQNTAYVGTSFTAPSFKIEGIATSTEYTLYRFNNDLYFEDNGETMTYQNFMSNKESLFEGVGRKYFTNIVAKSDLDEKSEDYEEYSAYEWDASSRSFVPQDANSFYLIKCEVTSTRFPTQPKVSGYMGVAAADIPDSIAGENTWLRDNITSVILLSIAGAALLGIILLLVIKPRDKKDIDAQYEEEVAAKAEKQAKKRK